MQWDHTGVGRALNPNAGILIMRGNLDTDMNTGRKPGEGKSRDLAVISTSHGRAKVASKAPKMREEA